MSSSINNGNSYVEFTESNLKISFKDIIHNDKSFVNQWLSNPNQLNYDRKLFIPYNGTNINSHIKNDYFNTFNGYNININEPVPEDYLTIIKPYLKVVKELCEGDNNYFDYYINYISHIIQFPNYKREVAVFFRGEQGIGKNLHLEAISNIIGSNYYLTTNKSDDLFGKFACDVSTKLIVNWNEADKIGNLIEDLKIFITEEIKVSEQKCKNKIETRNISTLIGTTNRLCPLPLEQGSRRFAIFQATDKMLKQKYIDNDFFAKLANLIKTPIFIASLYKYLNERDLSNYNYKLFPKNTKAYVQIKQLSMPYEISFLIELLNTVKDTISIKGSDLFAQYNMYCDSSKLKNEVSNKIFFARLENHKLGGSCIKSIKHHAIYYTINSKLLHPKLIELGFINNDEYLFID